MVETGRYITIPIEQIISAVKMTLKIESGDHDIWLANLVHQGAGNQGLRTLSTTIKDQCGLTINDNRAKLPVGFNQLISLRYNANNAQTTENNNLNCVPMLYVDMAFLNNCGCNTNLPFIQNMKGVFQINDGHLLFYGSVVDGTEANMAYFKNNVDKNGLQIVYERYERALTAYLCYKYTLQNASEYNQYVIESYRQEWMAQKRMIRSADARDSFNNTKFQLMEISNALIVEKNWTTTTTQ